MHMNKQTRIEYCEKEMQMKLNKICKFCGFATKIKAILFQTKKSLIELDSLKTKKTIIVSSDEKLVL